MELIIGIILLVLSVVLMVVFFLVMGNGFKKFNRDPFGHEPGNNIATLGITGLFAVITFGIGTGLFIHSLLVS